MTPIKIDLRNLTQAHVDEATAHMGECFYTAPCIIGTLIPIEFRQMLDDGDQSDKTSIDRLVRAGLIEFPDTFQLQAAEKLQNAFDANDLPRFSEQVAPWLAA